MPGGYNHVYKKWFHYWEECWSTDFQNGQKKVTAINQNWNSHLEIVGENQDMFCCPYKLQMSIIYLYLKNQLLVSGHKISHY